MKKLGWILFVFFAVFVGIYPFMYFVVDMSSGLMASKTPELLTSSVWNSAFYLHITFGAISLLTGWSQFSQSIRKHRLRVHRTLGKVYLISVAISGVAGLYIALFATGGIIAIAGFLGLAISWLVSSGLAYRAIRNRDIDTHEQWMIRSYALCFAAVTLRIWLPLFQFGFQMDFIAAYLIIAWLCWVPNLIIAEIIIRSKFSGAIA